MKPEEFFGQHWNRQALYQPGPPEKFSGLFDRAAFLRGIGQCADLKVGYTDENGWPAHFQIQPGQAESMLAAGKTVCAAGIEQNDERLTAFLARIQTRFGVAGRFFFNCYLSPDGAGFDLHLDDHPVCILQIEGQKRWWYSPEPALPAVLSNISFPKNRQTLQLPWVTVTRPRPEELAEVVLSPGDLLYLPKGSWHRAQAIGESLALTLAMQSVSPLDLLQNALGPKLDNAVFRSALPGYWAGEPDNGIPVALEAAFETALTELRALLNSTTAAELYTLWSRAAAAASQRKGPAA
jgi:ribosomal protein L16 Arg81 hydroxylase